MIWWLSTLMIKWLKILTIWWSSGLMMECCNDGVIKNKIIWWLSNLFQWFCRPTVAGIHGNESEGCYSLALSGGYEDDLDYGVCFTYTGEGKNQLLIILLYLAYGQLNLRVLIGQFEARNLRYTDSVMDLPNSLIMFKFIIKPNVQSIRQRNL